MNALQIEGVVAPKKPIVGTLPRCCAHAGYGLTTGASAAPHSTATNARRRRSIGATTWVSQPRTASSLRAAFGRRPSRVGRLFEDLARRHLRATTDSPWYGDAKRGRGVLVNNELVPLLQLDWKISQLYPTQNLVHEIGRAQR